MGQGQSSSTAGTAAETTVKTSYYTLIGVERDATDEEIKKAYRKKALELHPDRNHGNEEHATKVFAEIQAAYEVLSDPQERAWYDSHEGAILRGFDGGEEGGQKFAYNIKLTTSDDVARFMSASHGRKVDFDNVPSKFFTELRELFEKLVSEESIAARMEGVDNPDFPSFGIREDDYETVVKPFYAAWGGFTTIKSYSWEDKYNLADGMDRRIRRAMEKENRKLRDDAIREFNDTVRMLVNFVRKRDPRYKPNFQTDAERQKALREASAAQAARSRAANQARMNSQLPDWAQKQSVPEDDEDSEIEEEEEVSEQFDCVVCYKTFKSEKQFEAHERSKKHQQAVKTLTRKMKKENSALNLDDTASSRTASPFGIKDDEAKDEIAEDQSDLENGMENLEVSTDLNISDQQKPRTEPIDQLNGQRQGSASSSEHETQDGDEDGSDGEYASREEVLSRIGGASTTDQNEDEPQEDSIKPKLGKAKQKKARKAAQQAVLDDKEAELRFKCAMCKAAFPSRTRLFDHIKDFGHAAPIPQGGKKKGKGKR